MKKLLLLSFTLGHMVTFLQAQKSEDSLLYAIQQLKQASFILSQLRQAHQNCNSIQKRTQEIATEAQALLLLQKNLETRFQLSSMVLEMHQQEHFERIQSLFENESQHPLLKKVVALQTRLNS